MKLPKKKFICALIEIMLTSKRQGMNQGDKHNQCRTQILKEFHYFNFSYKKVQQDVMFQENPVSLIIIANKF